MNNAAFSDKLKEITKLEDEKCKLINETLHSNFIFGKRGKEQIVRDIAVKLNMSSEDADKIYNSCMQIMGGEIKNKLKNPFKSLD